MNQGPGEGTGESCSLCGARNFRFRFEKEGYRHYECRICRSMHVLPTPGPEELSRFYSEKDKQCSKICWESSREHFYPVWQKALDRIEKKVGRGPVLDYGCGGGQFLAFAARQGWGPLYGLDLSPQAVEIARERSGAKVECSNLVDADFGGTKFSAVTLWDVVEHHPAPGDLIEQVKKLLKPGGVVVLSVPHLHGISLRLLKGKALTYMPPEHLTIFSITAMTVFLKRHGFQPLLVESTDVFIREWTRFLPGGKKAGEAGQEEKKQEEKKYQECYQQAAGKKASLVVIGFINFFIRNLRLGDELVAVAQKMDGADE
jgi:2-polyprenyl-6-hydroxyphenyl methylase / 3-demethylubiquinone-9 3-methyltransferase